MVGIEYNIFFEKVKIIIVEEKNKSVGRKCSLRNILTEDSCYINSLAKELAFFLRNINEKDFLEEFVRDRRFFHTHIQIILRFIKRKKIIIIMKRNKFTYNQQVIYIHTLDKSKTYNTFL